MKKYPCFLLVGFPPVVPCDGHIPGLPVRLGGGGDSRGSGGSGSDNMVPDLRFSNWSYTLMFFWLACHTVGAHYTFAEVPFEWFRELVGAHRNPFDRIAHFTVGFYAFPVAEYLVRKQYAGKILAGDFRPFLRDGRGGGL